MPINQSAKPWPPGSKRGPDEARADEASDPFYGVTGRLRSQAWVVRGEPLSLMLKHSERASSFRLIVRNQVDASLQRTLPKRASDPRHRKLER